MFEIKNLHVSVDNKPILRGLNLKVGPGEMHAVMGPNGAGKSTFAQVVAGRSGYQIDRGSIIFNGEDLLEKSAAERAVAGLFLAFQYPLEIPGLNTSTFLRAALNSVREHRGDEELDAMDFLALVKEKMRDLNIDESFLYRAVNAGFSGGEKKRNEIFQMAVLEPRLAILDEIDSGLDIDALKIVAEGINRLRSSARSMIMVTHYQRLLNYVEPDYVHVLSQGCIVKSGGKELALELEEFGYAQFGEEAAEAVG